MFHGLNVIRLNLLLLAIYLRNRLQSLKVIIILIISQIRFLDNVSEKSNN